MDLLVREAGPWRNDANGNDQRRTRDDRIGAGEPVAPHQFFNRHTDPGRDRTERITRLNDNRLGCGAGTAWRRRG